jgi:hypothetical protein
VGAACGGVPAGVDGRGVRRGAGSRRLARRAAGRGVVLAGAEVGRVPGRVGASGLARGRVSGGGVRRGAERRRLARCAAGRG